MQILELSRLTGVAEKTIRYYESIGVLPPPEHKSNGYRVYHAADVERVRFVAGARSLGFSLDDIAEIMGLRDRQEAPCRIVLDLLEQKAGEIAHRIRELQRLEADLRELKSLGETFPIDEVDWKNCVCHLVSQRARLDIK